MKEAKELAKEAKKNGICNDWYLELKATEEREKLLDLYIRGIDFCLSKDYPTKEYIRANFKGKMEHRGVHLDEALSLKNERRVIALGACTGTVDIDSYNVSEVFLKHDSDLVINASGNSFVMVDMFENSKLVVNTIENAKVCVNRYGGEVTFSSINNSTVKIKDKHKSTY